MQAPPRQPSGAAGILEAFDLQALIDILAGRGFEVVGPVVREGVIAYERLDDAGQLPVGWTDTQEPGRYRLEKNGRGELFGFAVGPHAWKRFLHLAERTLLRTERDAAGRLQFESEPPPESRFAFLGVRPCELAAIGIHDRVLTGGLYADPTYASLRGNLFVVAVNCVRPAATCFCASMQTGPGHGSGFDLALTELCGERRHAFLVEAGSEAGREVLEELPLAPATPLDMEEAAGLVAKAAASMTRTIDARETREALLSNLEHPRWEEIATRCLACANCTMVCPTCFCVNVEERVALDASVAERVQRWDSCFGAEFSYIHGGSVREAVSARYRQWMTHKLATWVDQFGTSGCVGCGRCITWCPAGIDITEEARFFAMLPKEVNPKALESPVPEKS
jgi:sulfhydrogenase subunit beta (sulfur reductase)